MGPDVIAVEYDVCSLTLAIRNNLLNLIAMSYLLRTLRIFHRDYCLFFLLKNSLRGKRISSINDIKIAKTIFF